ncbi:hypothetical protein IQ06DRAFT_124299 [Phaeosphaeriaceae sp. SRC1lsM3a]|nr:hypothetical protein IQ06DRAFT_124299 [Stagonospora sp. SRC1lsM3a]
MEPYSSSGEHHAMGLALLRTSQRRCKILLLFPLSCLHQSFLCSSCISSDPIVHRLFPFHSIYKLIIPTTTLGISPCPYYLSGRFPDFIQFSNMFADPLTHSSCVTIFGHKFATNSCASICTEWQHQ